MKFISMCKDYWNWVMIPCWDWFKRYWKEYALLTIVFAGGVWLYYSWLFHRVDALDSDTD